MQFYIFIEKDNLPREAISDDLRSSVEATPRDEILLAEMHRRYDLQQGEIDTINTKAGLVLAYFGTLLVIVATEIPGILQQVIQAKNIPAIIAASVSLLLYLCGVFCCVVAIAPWTVLFPIGIEQEEIEFYLSQNRNDAMLQLLGQYSEYTQENRSKIKSKNRWFFIGLILSLGFTLASISTIYLVSL